jgi:3-hydroxyisobutyrate dehydrogenase-like beta-hydroxyacid dehydrogenase
VNGVVIVMLPDNAHAQQVPATEGLKAKVNRPGSTVIKRGGNEIN